MTRTQTSATVCGLIACLAGCGGTAAVAGSTPPADGTAANVATAVATTQAVTASSASASTGTSVPATSDSDASPAAPPAAGAAAAANTSNDPAHPLLTAADRTSFAKLGASLPGYEGVAVSYLGLRQPVYRAGTFATGVAWSSSKPAVAMATIVAGVGTAADRKQAITASDNDAAERLFAALGSPARAATLATAQVRAAGDAQTTIQSQRLRGSAYTAFGQTNWSLTNEARFAAGIGCTTAGRDVLKLMRQVIPSQRWGLGTIGAAPAIKGGWGPGIRPGVASGWLDRQLGIVTIDRHPIAVAIASTASDHASATAALTKIAAWLKTHVDTAGAPPAATC